MAGQQSVQVVGDPGRAVVPLAPALRSSSARYRTHSTILIAILLLMSIGFCAALLDGSPLFAIGIFLVPLISTAILSVAWMRPDTGSPEHHPKIDHFLDDTSP